MLETDAVLGRLERLRGLEPPMSITLWNGRRLASAPAPRVNVTIHTPQVLASLVHPTMGKPLPNGRLAFPATREYIYAG